MRDFKPENRLISKNKKQTKRGNSRRHDDTGSTSSNKEKARNNVGKKSNSDSPASSSRDHSRNQHPMPSLGESNNAADEEKLVLPPLTDELLNTLFAEFNLQEMPSAEERLWGDIASFPIGSLTEHVVEELDHTVGLWLDEKKWTLKRALFAERILFRMESEEKLLAEMRVVNLNQEDSTRKESDAAKFYSLVKPSYQLYVAVINAYAKTHNSAMVGERANYILKHLDRRAENEKRIDLKPNRFAINTAIGAHCKSTHFQAPESAEKLLARLEIEYEAGDNDMKPSQRSYSKVIDAYARRGDAEGAYKVLLRMVTEFENGNDDAVPSTIIYTSVIDAFSKSRSTRNAPEKAEELLRYILRLYDEKKLLALKPDCTVFSATIDAWARTDRRDKGKRAMDILEMMKAYVQPDLVTYNIVINALVENDGDICYAEDMLEIVERNRFLRADDFTYNSLLKAYFRLAERKGGTTGAQRAQDLINHWEQQYLSGHTDFQPDSHSYYALIKAWGLANTQGAASKADDVLTFMEEHNIHLNKYCYNAVLHSWARSFDHDAPKHAERVFEKLRRRYNETRDKKLKPDAFSYYGLIVAYAGNKKTNPPYRAEDMLREMVNSKEIENPDRRTFNVVINGWSQSANICNGDNPGSRADSLVDLMLSIGIKPDTINMNSVITAHVYSNIDKSEVLGAMAALRRMHELHIPTTSVTYTILLKASHLYRDDTIEEIFNDCIDRGMLDDNIRNELIQIRRPPHMYAMISQKRRLPEEWSRNATRGPATKGRNQLRREYEMHSRK